MHTFLDALSTAPRTGTLTLRQSALCHATGIGLALATGGLVTSEATLALADPGDGEIVATVSHLRNTSGVVRIALYADREAWLSHDDTLASCVAQVHGNEASCSLGTVPPGTYAIALLHDEDADGDMDRDFIGLPQEGYGFSSGATPGFGPPSFEDASFAHHGDRTVASIRARYGI